MAPTAEQKIRKEAEKRLKQDNQRLQNSFNRQNRAEIRRTDAKVDRPQKLGFVAKGRNFTYRLGRDTTINLAQRARSRRDIGRGPRGVVVDLGKEGAVIAGWGVGTVVNATAAIGRRLYEGPQTVESKKARRLAVRENRPVPNRVFARDRRSGPFMVAATITGVIPTAVALPSMLLIFAAGVPALPAVAIPAAIITAAARKPLTTGARRVARFIGKQDAFDRYINRTKSPFRAGFDRYVERTKDPLMAWFGLRKERSQHREQVEDMMRELRNEPPARDRTTERTSPEARSAREPVAAEATRETARTIVLDAEAPFVPPPPPEPESESEPPSRVVRSAADLAEPTVSLPPAITVPPPPTDLTHLSGGQISLQRQLTGNAWGQGAYSTANHKVSDAQDRATAAITIIRDEVEKQFGADNSERVMNGLFGETNLHKANSLSNNKEGRFLDSSEVDLIAGLEGFAAQVKGSNLSDLNPSAAALAGVVRHSHAKNSLGPKEILALRDAGISPKGIERLLVSNAQMNRAGSPGDRKEASDAYANSVSLDLDREHNRETQRTERAAAERGHESHPAHGAEPAPIRFAPPQAPVYQPGGMGH